MQGGTTFKIDDFGLQSRAEFCVWAYTVRGTAQPSQFSEIEI